MQAVRQHMQLGVLPCDEFAVHPDEAITLVEGQNGHDENLRKSAKS